VDDSSTPASTPQEPADDPRLDFLALRYPNSTRRELALFLRDLEALADPSRLHCPSPREEQNGVYFISDYAPPRPGRKKAPA